MLRAISHLLFGSKERVLLIIEEDPNRASEEKRTSDAAERALEWNQQLAPLGENLLTILEGKSYYESREDLAQSAERCWHRLIGRISPPLEIPQNFIDSLYLQEPLGGGSIIETCRLLYVSRVVQIIAGESSRFILNEQGKLIDGGAPIGKKRMIEVSITLNNVMTLLARRNPRIGGIHEESCEELIARCGDAPVASHWSLLRIEPIDPSKGGGNFVIAPLIDRILLTAFLDMGSQSPCLDTQKILLATITPPDSYQHRVLFRWEKSKFDRSRFYLRLYPYSSDHPVAVGLPATKSC